MELQHSSSSTETEEKKKTKFLKFFGRKNKEGKKSGAVDDQKEKEKLSLPLTQFYPNGKELKPFSQPNKSRDSASASPCSSRSRTPDLFDPKISTLGKLDALLSSRNNSEHSISLTDSCELQLIKNNLEWKYKVLRYQEKYHLLVQQRIKSNGDHTTDWDRWDGNFPKKSDSHLALKKLANSLNLTKKDVALVQWIVLTEIQGGLRELPSKLVTGAIPFMFEKVVAYLSEDCLCEEYIGRFWGSVEKLCAESVANLDAEVCMKILTQLPVMISPSLYSIKFFGILYKFLHNSRTNITQAEVKAHFTLEACIEEVVDTFKEGARKWFENRASMVDNSTIPSLANVAQILRIDLFERKESLQRIFASFNVNLFDLVYSAWTTKYGELVTPAIEFACSQIIESDRNDISNATVIDFVAAENLYKLLDASKTLFLLADQPKLFHDLFRPCIPHWLDVNCVKVLSYLEKAVKLDTLLTNQTTSRTSRSATDAEDILLMMEKLWNELDWPDLKERYTFAILIIKNLDRCILYYAELVANRLKELENSAFEDFEISDQLCIALNNVEKVRFRAEAIVTNLKISNIVENLAQQIGCGSSLQDCKNTPPALMENLDTKLNRKMLDCFESACCNAEHMITILLETAVSSGSPDLEYLMSPSISHLNRILQKLKSRLSHDGFNKAFAILWNNTFRCFSEIVEACIKAKKLPVTFQALESSLQKLEYLFFPEPNAVALCGQDVPHLIANLRSNIHELATPTPELILEYYRERLEGQNLTGISQNIWSCLTVVPDRNCGTGQLRLQILNAFIPQCNTDCYVKFQIVTQDFSETTKKEETKVVKRNEYLDFEDPVFIIDLTENDWGSNGLIHFWIRGRTNGFRWKGFMGEAFLPLKDIPVASQENPIRNSAQVRLPLTKPSESSTSRLLRILCDRTGDRFATKFANTELQRMNPTEPTNAATTPP